MKFLDLKGLQALWTKVLASRTVIESGDAAGAAAKINIVESSNNEVGKKFTISLNGVAASSELTAGLKKLYGTDGDIPATPAATITSLKEAVDGLTTSSAVTVEQQTTAENGYASTYVVKQNGTQVGVKINIPKDFLVKSASVETVETADSPYQGAVAGEKYIDFVVNTTDASETAQHIYLPVNELVDVYTGGNGIDITSSNVVNGVVDPTSETFLTVGANGFKLDGVQSAINTAKAEVLGDSEDTKDDMTVYGVKKYAENIASAVGVTATGDTYVSASVDNTGRAITIGATQSTKDSLALADSALQGVDTTAKGTNVKVTLGKDSKNVTVAVDETALGTALDGKVDKVEGSSLMTQAEHEKLAAVEASADVNVIEVVKVNGTALSVSAADKSVDIDLSGKADKVSSATSGNFAGLDGNGNLTDSGSKAADFAAAAQGAKADTAIQGVTGETAITGGESSYVAVTASEDAAHEVTLASSVKVQAVGTADSSNMGLAEASDVKTYVDTALAQGHITIAEHTESATGTPAVAGTMVVSAVTTENGGVTGVTSVEVEAAGAAAAARTAVIGDASTNGNTLGKLEDRLETLEGSGSGSIDSRITTAIQGLDSSVNGSVAPVISSTTSSNDGSTTTHVTAATVLTSVTIEDGKFSAATSQTIEAIDDTDLTSILVA